jgi:hypothetical protein
MLKTQTELFEVCTLEVDLTAPRFQSQFELIPNNPGVIRLEVKVTMKLAEESLSASVTYGQDQLAGQVGIEYA